MKQSPEMRRVVERMAPGVLSRDGFLGTDRRGLEEILEADASTVAALGLSHEELAARLRVAYEKALGAFGTPVALSGDLLGVFAEAMGRIPCPWGGCGTFPKGEVEAKDTTTGETIRFTALSIHLVERHGFYQGRGSRYRLEPAALARLLPPT